MESKQFVKPRESSIELLKIFAMFLIVTAHVSSHIKYLQLDEMSLDYATTDPQSFIMAFLSYLGILGNYIFIICSAWFLIGKEKNYKSKILHLILDVFVISVGILCISLISGVNISKTIILKSLFPTTFSNNWFITCYMLFLLVLPFLNKILNQITKKQLLSINIVLFILYSIMAFLSDKFFFYSRIILFIQLFFAAAYLKIYLPDFQKNVKKNLICLFIGAGGFLLLLIFTNLLGLKIGFMSDKLLYWWKTTNPFFFLIAVSLFNLVRRVSFSDKTVNLISSVSLFVYLIHDNLIVRGNLRKDIWLRTIDKFSLDYVLLEDFIFIIALFAVSLLISLLYKFTVGKFVAILADKIYNSQRLRKAYFDVFNKIADMK